MEIKKKYLVAGALAFVTITGALVYLQIQKLKEYCISLKLIKLNDFSLTNVDIDIILNFVNKSKFKLTIFSQEYNLFINKAFALKVSNSVPQIIQSEATSPIAVKLQLKPEAVLAILKTNLADIVQHREKVEIKIGASLKVGVGIIKFTVPYTYVTNLAEITSKSTPNSSAKKC